MHIFEIFSTSFGFILIKLVIHDPYDKDIDSCIDWGGDGLHKGVKLFF